MRSAGEGRAGASVRRRSPAAGPGGGALEDDLIDDAGEVIGESEVAWESHRLAIVMEMESQEAFALAGWKAFTADESLADPSLLGKFKEES